MTTLTAYPDAPPTLANPFPGLRAFDIWENHLFFGRESQIDTLLWKLTRNHFVSVVGTSGSGKSSLVRSGLLPVLYGGLVAQAGSAWRIAMFRPGSDPIRNLAAALNADDVFGIGDEKEDERQTAITEATLEGSSLGLVQIIRQARMADDENLLIVVDQFEELFRFKENAQIDGAADQAAAFVRLLLEAIFQREVPVYVVLTIRSDFLGDCSQFRDLPETINDGQYLIPRLRREQIRVAITGPVAVGGGKIAPRLVQQLLNDVGDTPDQLPILQHALMRTWGTWVEDHEPGEPIDLRHYEAIGGMGKALSQHADEAYNELPDDRSRQICQSLFKALTERGPDNRGIRRPTRLGDICAVAGASIAEVIEVVDLFRRPGRSFIMPPHNVPLHSESVLDISHESLMRVWERLGNWVEEDAQSAQTYRRLVESALLYEEGHAGLWHDPDLQIAEEWREREKPNTEWATRYHPAFPTAMRFLDRSIEQREEEGRERRRRRRVAQVIGTAFLLCAAILTVWALNERAGAERNFKNALTQGQIAERQKTEAEHQRNLAQQQKNSAEKNRQLAEQQRLTAETQRTEAEHQKQLAEQQKSEALSQRQRAEAASKDALSSRDAAESQRRTAVEQKQIAVQQQSRAEALADSISHSRLLSLALGLAKTVQLHKVDQNDVNALLALQSFRFNQENGGNDRDPDIYGALFTAAKLLLPEKMRVMQGHSDGVRSVAYSPDGTKIASAGSDGRLLLWDTGSPTSKPLELAHHDFTIRSLAFHPDGRRIAYAGYDGTVRIIDRNGSQRIIELHEAVNIITSVAYLGNGDRLAVLGGDGIVRIWNVVAGRVERSIRMDGRIRSMTVIPESEMLAAGTESGTMGIWDMKSESIPPVMLPGYGSSATAIAISPDGKRLAVGSANGLLRLWNSIDATTPPVMLPGHHSEITSLVFNRDGKLLASASNDATVRLWDMQRPNSEPMVLREHTSWVWALAFSPDGNALLSGGFDHTLRVQPTRAELLIAPLHSRIDRNLSKQEWAQYIGSDIGYQRTVEGR